MHGFKPGAHGAKKRNFADGGAVTADADKKAAADKAKPLSPTVLGTGTAANAGKALAGRQAQLDAALNFADGGPVRGPGTGISDDIKKTVPEGSYIMPADSTEQIGEQALEGMGAPRDVNLSNGEYELPPEQVHAVGVQALDQMKDSTHTPAAEQARGFDVDLPQGDQAGAPAQTKEPEMFFADGGVVDDDERKRAQVPGDPARAARMQAQYDQPVTGPQPRGFMPQARTEGPGWRTDSVLAGTGEDVSRLAGEGQYARAAGAAVRGTAAVVPAAFMDAGDDVANAAGFIARPIANFGKGLLGIEDQAAQPAAAKPAAATPAAAAPANVATQQSAPRSNVATPAAAQPELTQPESQGADLANNVVRDGNSFSGTVIGPGFTVNGRQPAPPSGPRSAQNESAVQALMARTPEMGAGPLSQASAAAAPAGAGFAPRNSLTVIADSSREGRDRSALMSAARTPYAGAQNGQLTANQLNTARGLLDSEQRDATSRYTSDQNNASGFIQAQLREQGATQRAAIQEGGQNARFQASNSLDQQRLAGEQEVNGFKTRAAQRVERLYQQYDSAKPEERAAIAQQIRELNGDQTQQRFTVVPGGQEIDPTTQQLVTRPAQVLNNQTGQFLGQQQAALPPIGENPAVQQIMNNTSLSREERAKQIRALGYQ